MHLKPSSGDPVIYRYRETQLLLQNECNKPCIRHRRPYLGILVQSCAINVHLCIHIHPYFVMHLKPSLPLQPVSCLSTLVHISCWWFVRYLALYIVLTNRTACRIRFPLSLLVSYHVHFRRKCDTVSILLQKGLFVCVLSCLIETTLAYS